MWSDVCMSEAALIGVTQVIATLFVFIAVEARSYRAKARGPQRRMTLVVANYLGLGLMMIGFMHALIALAFETPEAMPAFRVEAVKMSVIVSLIMTAVSLWRLMLPRLIEAADQSDDHPDRNRDR